MSDLTAQEKRIARILVKIRVPPVNSETLRTYVAYLRKNVTLPCRLTGVEDFRWEERYVFGYGDKAEYERLKKTRPS